MSEFIEEKIDGFSEYDYKWYILQTYNAITNRANFVNDEKRRVKRLQELAAGKNLQDHFQEIFLPIIEQKDIYTQEVKEVNLAPGYIYIKMHLTSDIKRLLMHSRTGILMGGYANPHVVPDDKVDKIKANVAARMNVNNSFLVGEAVRITKHDFADFDGIISEVLTEEASANVCVTIFGRNTIIKFPLNQLEKIIN